MRGTTIEGMEKMLPPPGARLSPPFLWRRPWAAPRLPSLTALVPGGLSHPHARAATLVSGVVPGPSQPPHTVHDSRRTHTRPALFASHHQISYTRPFAY